VVRVRKRSGEKRRGENGGGRVAVGVAVIAVIIMRAK